MNWRNIKEKIIVWGSLIIAIAILYLMYFYLPFKMPPIDTYNYEPAPDEVGRSIYP